MSKSYQDCLSAAENAPSGAATPLFYKKSLTVIELLKMMKLEGVFQSEVKNVTVLLHQLNSESHLKSLNTNTLFMLGVCRLINIFISQLPICRDVG